MGRTGGVDSAPKKIGRDSCREKLIPEGMIILQANRDALGQTVFHLYMHVIPRYKKDQLVQPCKSIG